MAKEFAIEPIGDTRVLSAIAAGESTLVIVLGGAVSCVVSLGVLHALMQYGRLERVRKFLGVSGGACNVAALLDNPDGLDRVLDVYKHVAREGIIGFKWFGRKWGVNIDIDALLRILQGNHAGLPWLNEQRISARNVRFHVAVTDRQSAKCYFPDAKHDLFDALGASMRVPVGGNRAAMPGTFLELVDGAVGFDTVKAIRALRAPNVLIIMNRVLSSRRWWAERKFGPRLASYTLRSETLALQKAAECMDDLLEAQVHALLSRAATGRCHGVRVLALAPNDSSIMPLVLPMRVGKLVQWYESAYRSAKRLVQSELPSPRHIERSPVELVV